MYLYQLQSKINVLCEKGSCHNRSPCEKAGNADPVPSVTLESLTWNKYTDHEFCLHSGCLFQVIYSGMHLAFPESELSKNLVHVSLMADVVPFSHIFNTSKRIANLCLSIKLLTAYQVHVIPPVWGFLEGDCLFTLF